LLNEKFDVISNIQDKNIFSFNNIKNGKYFLRLLIWDINKPQWSFGDIYHKKEHDKVIFYDKEINIIQKENIKDINFNI
jgi:hypothetical protein